MSTTEHALTPSAIRRALAGRISSGTALVEVGQIGGVLASPASTAARCYAIRSDDAEREGPGRTGDCVGVRRRWLVDLLHSASPTAGPGVWDEALDDEAAVRRALLATRDDALRRVEDRIVWLGSTTPTLEGSGAYRRVSLRFEITTPEILE